MVVKIVLLVSNSQTIMCLRQLNTIFYMLLSVNSRHQLKHNSGIKTSRTFLKYCMTNEVNKFTCHQSIRELSSVSLNKNKFNFVVSQLFPEAAFNQYDDIRLTLNTLYELLEKEDKTTDDNSELPVLYETHIPELKKICETNASFSSLLEKIKQMIRGNCLHEEYLHNNMHKVISEMSTTLKLSGSEILNVISCEPELLRSDPENFTDHVDLLRNFKVNEEDLLNAIKKFPKLLLIDQRKLETHEYFLISNLDFTRSEISKLLSSSPCVFVDPCEVTKEKMDYIMIEMSSSVSKAHEEVAQFGILSKSFEFLRLRHTFLKRRGLHQQPDKTGFTHIINPTLKDAFATTDNDFCKESALCDVKEFNIFKEVYALEMVIEQKLLLEENDQYVDMEEDDNKLFC